MKRLMMGVMAAVVALSFAMAGCDKKVKHSEIKQEDVKYTAELVLSFEMRNDENSYDPHPGAPNGAKVIAFTTGSDLYGNAASSETIVVQTVDISGKSATLTLPVSEKGTTYYLKFSDSAPTDYKKTEGIVKYYYKAESESVDLYPGDKVVERIIFQPKVKAE